MTDDKDHKGEVRVSLSNGAVTRTAYGLAIRVDRNGWHHVVVLLDRDSGITVLVDGTARTTPGAFTGSLANTGELILGKSTNLFIPYYRAISTRSRSTATCSRRRASRPT